MPGPLPLGGLAVPVVGGVDLAVHFVLDCLPDLFPDTVEVFVVLLAVGIVFALRHFLVGIAADLLVEWSRSRALLGFLLEHRHYPDPLVQIRVEGWPHRRPIRVEALGFVEADFLVAGLVEIVVEADSLVEVAVGYRLCRFLHHYHQVELAQSMKIFPKRAVYRRLSLQQGPRLWQ